MSPRVHILAPVHNRRAVTEKFIRNLLRQTYDNWHLLLIDDGSKDGTEAMARALVPAADLTILRGQGNWWWAGGLQQGYLWLKQHDVNQDDVVVTMNDDTEFENDFLAIAVKALKPRSLLMARTMTMDGGLDELGVHWDWKTLAANGVTDAALVNCFATRGLFLRAGDFVALGGFYPRLLPHYLSDYEFSIRAHRRGFALISVPELHLRFDDDPALTGIRSTEGLGAFQAMRQNLSIRSTSNPFYWTSFVLLSSPARYAPSNVWRVWWRFLWPLRAEIRHALVPVRRLFARGRALLGRIKRKIKREWNARIGTAP